MRCATKLHLGLNITIGGSGWFAVLGLLTKFPYPVGDLELPVTLTVCLPVFETHS